jgi:NAD(P)-dependent dehydrogenase (short-subunit alcohol dehydrogenase family)
MTAISPNASTPLGSGPDGFGSMLAVVTGGGTGMGRELTRQLAAEGCDVAICDLSAEQMAETERLAIAGAPAGVRITTVVADVGDEAQIVAFRDAVADAHGTDHIELLFNNAGIGGGGSLVADDRADWERTFNICWGGVYLTTRAFLPMLLAAPQGHVINTSSINGLWASLGPGMSHSAYSAAKFAVRGFTEALITDFALNAPHLRASVVMPGHIGTEIALNSARIHEREPKDLTAQQVQEVRDRLERRGLDLAGASDEDIRLGIQAMAEAFRDQAPMTAAMAATVILDGVRAGRWRILVGDDAAQLDELVRATPEDVYDPAFYDLLAQRGIMNFGLG